MPRSTIPRICAFSVSRQAEASMVTTQAVNTEETTPLKTPEEGLFIAVVGQPLGRDVVTANAGQKTRESAARRHRSQI